MVTINPYLGVSKKPGYKKKQVNAYNSVNMKQYHLNINRYTEKELLKWMEANRPYQAALKRLIREEIAREKKGSKQP